jgi:acyl-coenzyme A synthetase/AMP-(fatty) acid ligase
MSKYSLSQLCAAALARPASAPAVEYERQWYSWGDLHTVAEQVTALLRASGASPKSAIVLVARNRPSAIATEFALVAAGCTIKMVYTFQSPESMAANIARLEPAVVIAENQDFSDAVRAEMTTNGMAGIVIRESAALPLAGLERVTGAAPDAGDPPRIEILTSGTTGSPKQFPIPYALIADHHVAAALKGAAGKDTAAAPPAMIYAPLGNISGIYMTFAPLIAGYRAVLWDRFNLDLWLAYVRTYRPANSGLPCACVQELLARDVPQEDFASIQSMGMGAAPLDPTLQQEFEERYGIPMLVTYGATEFGGPVCGVTMAHIKEFGCAKRGSVGRPFTDAKLRVVDPETGAELAVNAEGLIEVISPRIGSQWLRTADIGMIDEDGFVWLRGRADGAIMRGGFKVLPETIERALLLHPAVSDAGVVGVADARLGQVPAAAIIAKPGIEPPGFTALEAHLRQHVMATHIPKHWRYVAALPKNPSAKFDRLELKRMFEDVSA